MLCRVKPNLHVLIYNSFRCFSGSAPLINVEVSRKTGFTTATLQKPPINGLCTEFISEFSKVLKELETSRCTGLILTSNFKTVFSAGIDFKELHKPNLEGFKKFWTGLQDLWIDLYGCSYPTVAVINGHAPAGGCLLALSCEYRIMVKDFTIGLNETAVGLTAPPMLMSAMKNAIGSRQAELALTSSKLFNTEEALQVGLVDEMVASKEEGIERAEAFLRRFANIPSHARALTKRSLRAANIQTLRRDKEVDFEKFYGSVASPEVQQSLGQYLGTLKQRKK